MRSRFLYFSSARRARANLRAPKFPISRPFTRAARSSRLTRWSAGSSLKRAAIARRCRAGATRSARSSSSRWRFSRPPRQSIDSPSSPGTYTSAAATSPISWPGFAAASSRAARRSNISSCCCRRPIGAIRRCRRACRAAFRRRAGLRPQSAAHPTSPTSRRRSASASSTFRRCVTASQPSTPRIAATRSCRHSTSTISSSSSYRWSGSGGPPRSRSCRGTGGTGRPGSCASPTSISTPRSRLRAAVRSRRGSGRRMRSSTRCGRRKSWPRFWLETSTPGGARASRR